MPFITRRRVLTGLASSVALAPFTGCSWAQSPTHLTTDPFSLGVASGDPDATSVVLWTRLAPAPLEHNSGMPPTAVPVDWEIAEDEKMQRVVKRGTVEARPEDGHSLHVIPDGLTPNRPYWYRFMTSGAESRIGRTRTLPAPGTVPDRFRLAVGGCQRIEHGYFTAWKDIARSDVDAVFHYGDYIYEYDLNAGTMAKRLTAPLSTAALKKPTTLAGYRLRYALYKLDPDLAAAHAAHPFITSFDDHEVVNNWGGMSRPGNLSDANFLALRAAAFQAFYENAPVRTSVRPQGPNITAYRSFEIGRLMRLATLDTRQFRSLPACGKADTQHCDERLAANRSMIGADQERWLLGLFDRRDTTWTVLGNQVMMMQARQKDPAEDIVNTDKWDGNPAARNRLLQGATDRKVNGLIAVTGDLHRSIAGNLMVDFDKPNTTPIGAEFVATSVSSNGDSGPGRSAGARLQSNNPHLRFYDARRGYLVCDFNEKRCQATYKAVDMVSAPDAKVSTATTLTVEAKYPGLG